MSIAAIGAISGFTSAVSGVSGTGYLASPQAAEVAGASATQFGNAMSSIDTLQSLQTTTNDLAVKAVTGDLNDVHDYTIAASESKTALQLTAAVRNKALEAFSEIMRMQA